MSPVARRGRTRSRSGPKQAVRWAQATLSSYPLAAASIVVIDLLGGLTLTEKATVQTVLRIIGRVGFVADAINTEVFGRWGVTPVTDSAMAATVVPEPTTASDVENRWLVNNYFMWRKGVADLSQDSVDLRSKHRFRSSASTLAVVVSNVGAATQLFLGFRILYSIK